MHKIKVLFFPSHEPNQYLCIAKKLKAEIKNIQPIFFLLNKPNNEFPFKFYTYEDLASSQVLQNNDNDNDYGCNLNELILSDRIHRKDIDLRKTLNAFRLGFRNLLIDENIKCILGYALSDAITYSSYMIGKRLNIPYFYLNPARVGEYSLLVSKLNGGTDISLNLNNFTRANALELLQKKIQENQVPAYASDPTMVAGKSLAKQFISLIKLIIQRSKSNNKFLNQYLPISIAVQNYFNRKRSLKELRRVENSFQEFEYKKFIYYPLHLHPETATLIWGRWLNNQIEILRMISRSMPSDCIIIVKEHKVAEGRRPLGFYKAISKIPNTFIVNASTNPHEVISSSKIVATICGTAGLEGLCHGKPVLLFGDVCYKNIPNVIQALDISKMKTYIRKGLEDNFLSLEENFALQDYIQKRLNNSVELLNYSPHLADAQLIEKMSPLYSAVIKYVLNSAHEL